MSITSECNVKIVNFVGVAIDRIGEITTINGISITWYCVIIIKACGKTYNLKKGYERLLI